MTRTTRLILAVALAIGFSISAHNANAEWSVVDNLVTLERGWTDNCIAAADGTIRTCVEIVRLTVGRMHTALDAADNHEALKLLYAAATSACGEIVRARGIEGKSGEAVVMELGDCVIASYQHVIKERGGMLEFLLSTEAQLRGDPEI